MTASASPSHLDIAFVMDPIESIKPFKDTTFALMLAAQARGHGICVIAPDGLFMAGREAHGRVRPVRVTDERAHWYDWLAEASDRPLAEFGAVFMRKDPPFDMEYVYATQILERAEAAGARVVNRPQALRDFNEKLAILRFPEVTAPTLVSRDIGRLKAFHAEHGDVIYKPLDGMGGAGIFRVGADGMNLGSVIEGLTGLGRHTIMAQRYIPEIVSGDKRIVMIDGQPASHCLARIPQAGEVRGNLAAGGSGVVQPLSARDREIAARVGPELVKNGLTLVGLDVIGPYLTEVNVTSPTCLREISAATGQDLAGQVMKAALSSIT